MISRREAEALLRKSLGEDRRIRHSVTVAGWMEFLAPSFGGDAETWHLTGLLHDIDLPETMEDMSRHGILAAERLEGLLPAESLDAIRAHDGRTGIPARTDLARALVFADVLDNLAANAGREAVADCARRGAWNGLRSRFPGKRYPADVAEAFEKERPGSVERLLGG